MRTGATPELIDNDEIIVQLSSFLVGKYVILDYYKALSETLRIELPTYWFFDVATSVLVSNEALRRDGHFWRRIGESSPH